MAATLRELRGRIKSASSIKKITKAQELIATSRIAKAQARVDAARPYATEITKMLTELAGASALDHPLLVERENPRRAGVLVVSSDRGLCGGYNANVCRMVQADLDPADEITVIGSRGAAWFASHPDFHVTDTVADLNDDDAYLVLSKLMDKALRRYEAGEISKIQVLYTHYKNTLTFVPTLMTILPVEPKAMKTGGADTIYEPSQAVMTDKVIPMAAKSLLYSLYLESTTSEQASRRMAMESATDNATELQEELELEYNRIRQGAITQEITEIVSGANALV